MIRAAERERRAIQDLIAGLEKRFLAATRTDAVRHPQSAPAARHGIVRVHPHPTPHRVIRA
jgi:phospholipase/lecithinase/hemolysin